MAELALRCNECNRATVYRTVATFESIGVIRRVNSGWKYKVELSDLFDDHHHHATCDQCGATIELAEEPMIEHAIENLALKHQFALASHQIELRGVCGKCTSNSVQAAE
jgi:Fur family ferric uptake transcriptional regulator